jgi:hypothetical protein
MTLCTLYILAPATTQPTCAGQGPGGNALHNLGDLELHDCPKVLTHIGHHIHLAPPLPVSHLLSVTDSFLCSCSLATPVSPSAPGLASLPRVALGLVSQPRVAPVPPSSMVASTAGARHTTRSHTMSFSAETCSLCQTPTPDDCVALMEAVPEFVYTLRSPMLQP